MERRRRSQVVAEDDEPVFERAEPHESMAEAAQQISEHGGREHGQPGRRLQVAVQPELHESQHQEDGDDDAGHGGLIGAAAAPDGGEDDGPGPQRHPEEG